MRPYDLIDHPHETQLISFKLFGKIVTYPRKQTRGVKR